MKISVDDKELYTLRETQKKVIMNQIPEELFEQDMCRRIHWVLTHKYEQCYKELKEQWEPKLAQKEAMLPTDPDKFAELVFAQPEYKNRSQRDKVND